MRRKGEGEALKLLVYMSSTKVNNEKGCDDDDGDDDDELSLYVKVCIIIWLFY